MLPNSLFRYQHIDNVCVFICAHHKTDFVLFGYRILHITTSRHWSSSVDELHFVMGRGPLINLFLRVCLDVCRQSVRFIFRPSKQSWFFSGTEIYIPQRVDTCHHLWMNFTLSWGGGPLINVFLRVYFDVCRESVRFNFRPSKHSSFFSGTEI